MKSLHKVPCSEIKKLMVLETANKQLQSYLMEISLAVRIISGCRV
jgi:hypothetical protein